MHLESDDKKNKKLIDKAISFNGDFDIQDKKDSLLRYVINGVLMFYISFGCIGSFASAFSIEYYNVMLFFVLFVLSILYSFMHVNETTHKIGYVAILVCYIYMVFRIKIIIKSGFARIINVTLQKIQEKLSLARIKQYTEYVDDTKLAVTLCLIVIGFVMLLILNILISEYVNIVLTMIITSPLIIGSYYFEFKPNIFAVIMYVAGIIGLLVMRLNSKSTVYSNESSYYIDDEESKEKKYLYITSNKIHAHILVVVVVCVSVLSGVFTLVLKNNYKNSFFVTTFMKDTVDEKVMNMVTDTESGGSKSAVSGGLSKGKLGNVGEIKFDNKVDLKARFVPMNKESIYLRGYIGSIYESNSWKIIKNASNKKYNRLAREMNDAYGLEKENRVNYSYKMLEGTLLGIFTVENVEANSEYPYMPYYSELNTKCMKIDSDDEIYMKVNAKSYEMRYHPNSENNKQKIDGGNLNYTRINSTSLEQYYSYVKKIYTQVPKKNSSVMKTICEEMGIVKKTTYTNDEVNNIVDKIHSYFQKDFVYSTSCGVTPEGKDFINYFVEYKKGFCAHFASTGAMVLRYLGIPARYVEGYVISSDIINSGKKLSGLDASKYVSNAKKGKDYVVEVEIPDNKAHAWIEVYKENFGWEPYEMTVYDRREEASTTGGDVLSDDEINEIKNEMISAGKQLLLIFTIVVDVVLTIGIIAIFRFIMKRARRQRSFKDENYVIAISNLYDYLCQVMRFMGIGIDKGMTIDDYFKKLAKNDIEKKDILINVGYLIKKAAYSNQKVGHKEREYVKTQVENIVEIQYNKLDFKEKLKFRLIYNL